MFILVYLSVDFISKHGYTVALIFLSYLVKNFIRFHLFFQSYARTFLQCLTLFIFAFLQGPIQLNCLNLIVLEFTRFFTKIFQFTYVFILNKYSILNSFPLCRTRP